MSRKKNMYLIIDTETCNTVCQPLVYDIGYAICDRYGNVAIERSFMVAETFLDYKDILSSAYYSKKLPSYWEELKNGTREMKTLYNIRKIIKADMKKYNVKTVGAYNMAFDKRALNTTLRYYSKSFLRWFFPFDIKYICIWNMATQCFMDSRNYVNFCLKNGLLTEKGNIQSSAETCFKYLTKKLDFEEVHKGLDDVRIEIEIMARCFATHKKIDKSINTQCWRVPQKKRKEIEKNA